MTLIISAKGNGLTNWRAAENFTASFRQELLNRTSNLLSDQTMELFRDVESRLEERAFAHDVSLAQMRHLTDIASTAGDPAALKMLVEEFYAEAYRFFCWNRSATAFYRISGQFQRSVIKAVVGYARKRLELLSCRLPSVALIGLGRSGRNEYSPFCRMRLLLVHGDGEPAQLESLGAFGRILHEGLEAAGLMMDEVLTPRNQLWRLTAPQLPERLAKAMQGNADPDMTEHMAGLLYLADQAVLYDEDVVGENFQEDCLKLLSKSRPALHILMERLGNLTTGMGLLGGFKLERKGLHRGKFRLSDNALLPLTAAITALSLMNVIGVCQTSGRIRELLRNGRLNVETAERVLKAWHLFNELRLVSEALKQPDWGSQDVSYLDLATLDSDGQDEFRQCLEATAGILRHAVISYNDWEEQSAC